MTRATSFLFGLLACAALSSAAVAQNPQPAPPGQTHTPVAPPSSSQPPPEQIAPGSSMTPSSGTANLSERLAKDQGTVKPPVVDPGIQAPMPSRGQSTMPVIPPPGTPGGNPNVVPK